MNKNMKILLAASLVLLSTAASAANYTLTISSWSSPQHGINAKMWPRFIQMIEQATNGAVTAQVKLDLAAPTAQTDVVQDGIADIAIIAQSYNPGRFPSAKLVERPGYGSSQALSVAYWQAYERYLKSANEYRGLKLIALHVNGPAMLHANKKVTRLDQVAGMKLRITDEAMGRLINSLGASGVQVTAPKVYETLASHTADGVLMPMEARVGFRLTEVAKNVYTVPGGFGRFSFGFVMNQAAFNKLPQALRTALEENVFGERLSGEMGRIWDEIDDIGREGTLATADNSITPMAPADVARFRQQADTVTQALVAELSARGINAAGVVDMLNAAGK